MLRVIKELRDVAGKYAGHTRCDANLVFRARRQCETAYQWTRSVISRYRQSQLHLGSNMPARKEDFTPFDPFSDVSVYEFFMQYDDWARGYLSDEAQAYLLFTKYLPADLTESYEEIRSRRHNYDAMRSWLIDRYGLITAVADMKLQYIRSLQVSTGPKDLLGNTRYLRGIHRTVSRLHGLEVKKGVRVLDSGSILRVQPSSTS